MRVHLVDGTYELFRAFYGAPGDAARALASTLLALLTKEGATHVAVAFDHVIESFRNELFGGYKTGEGIDEDLRAQFEPAEEASRALGLVTWPMVEFEADDAIAAAAHRFIKDPRVEAIFLCSPDKDLMQCVDGGRVVCLDRRRKKVYDEPAVVEKMGVRPSSIPDLLALVGDTADGIPGIPRWGQKSAAAVLRAYPRLEDIPEDPARWTVAVRGRDRLCAELNERREEARLYRTLATLRTDVPLEESLDDLAWRGPDLPRLEALAERLGDGSIVARAQRASETRPHSASPE